MHIHGYAWLGEKADFDQDSLRRPPGPAPTPSSPPEVAERHRRATTEFPVTEIPPIQTAHWLLKPPPLVRGTWYEPKEAGEWLAQRLAEFAPRFSTAAEHETARHDRLVRAAVERLATGRDVSLGHYLRGTLFHSLALVTCSPNGTHPHIRCPAPDR
ncbi:hypothetical protein ACFVIM_10055 [Streptomyces sp. NPDC057638]|uniref:hypothetical protein n=1 Tax=Streptomyces sp. NPDC057638 TaxID=3346190 RepID=UPI0036B7318C